MLAIFRILAAFLLATVLPCGLYGQELSDAQILRCVPLDGEGRKIAEDAECPRYQTTIIQLLARPEIFDGKRVIVTGYIHRGFEDNGIYVRHQDFEDGLRHNGLWVDSFRVTADAEECQDSYVILEGLFVSRSYGHYGLWSGRITDVSRCNPR